MAMPLRNEIERIEPDHFAQKFLRELETLRLPSGPGSQAIVTDALVADLPETVRRYLHFMRVIGNPRTWSFRARFSGVFRRSHAERWMRCEVMQYDTSIEIARVFHMRMRFKGILPLRVRDTYVRGRGRMCGRLLDLASVVDVADELISTGELVTYLNDALAFAPSMLLGPDTTWHAVDDHSFDVTLTDCGRTVGARVFIDEQGAMTDFSTTDRFGEDPARPGRMVRTRWSTPMRGHRVIDGRPVPTDGKAIWHFPSGDLTYADFHFDDIVFDVPPRATHA